MGGVEGEVAGVTHSSVMESPSSIGSVEQVQGYSTDQGMVRPVLPSPNHPHSQAQPAMLSNSPVSQSALQQSPTSLQRPGMTCSPLTTQSPPSRPTQFSPRI